MNFAVLIPAYKPTADLPPLVEKLLARGVTRVIVVDDGSGPEHAHLFDAVRHLEGVTLLRHAVNLGKGAALKTGMNHYCCTVPDGPGVVTCDADGQHLPDDVVRVGRALEAHPDHLVLGVRVFAQDVPFRSRFGNVLTRRVFRLMSGRDVSDTQTGLRGVPRALLPKLLRLRSIGYEFELDMLLMSRQERVPILEEPIATVYIEDNRSSHFNPVVDSLKIYFVLLRFMLASLTTAALDYLVFAAAFLAGGNILVSQAAARLVATGYNYLVVKKLVFYSEQPDTRAFPRFVALVAVLGAVSYALITLQVERFGMRVIPAKMIAELTVYLANFAIQREFVFKRGEADAGA